MSVSVPSSVSLSAPVSSSDAPARPIGVIRVLTSEDLAAVATHGKAIEERYGLPTVSRCIPGQPHGIHDDDSEARAEPKIVDLARELADAGARTLIISCAADPALQKTRQAVGIPVIGAGSAAAAVALGLGSRVGVLGIRDEAPPAVRAVLGDHFAASARPDGVHRTTDLLAPEGPEAVLEERLGVPAVDPVLAAGLLASYAYGG